MNGGKEKKAKEENVAEERTSKRKEKKSEKEKKKEEKNVTAGLVFYVSVLCRVIFTLSCHHRKARCVQSQIFHRLCLSVVSSIRQFKRPFSLCRQCLTTIATPGHVQRFNVCST